MTIAPAYPTAEEHLAMVLDAFHETHKYHSEDLIRRAYDRSATAHAGQRRLSGEPYIHHPLSVAHILAKSGFDDQILAAALLHDVLEDTDERHEELERDFGSDVVLLVDGLTKISRFKLASRTAQQVTSLRKMLVTMAKDLRVLFIKFADRLHNMQTIAALPTRRQEAIAAETLQVYAPLADRLGMELVKSQLEDLSFAVLHPKWYAEIDHLVEERAPEREIYLTQVVSQIQGRLNEVLVSAEVTGRRKHLWSIFDKMQKKQLSFEEIHDLIGIRIITPNVPDCYAALGTVHAIWKPAQGRFKDYISIPKFNYYQSIHTTVVGPAGKLLEVQIRTEEMHRRAEYGVAAHWDYKGENPSAELLWLSRLMDWAEDADEPEEAAIASLTENLALEEVYTFTPQGEIVTLPAGATPVDFAYSIHTEVGHTCVGAKINGRLSALNTHLATGDTVEIFTSNSPDAGPSSDWLSFVVTHRASSRIRQWHSRERRAESATVGREEVMSALRKEGLLQDATLLEQVASDLGFHDVEDLFVASYRGQHSAQAIANRILRLKNGDAPEETAPVVPQVRQGEAPAASRGIHVEGQSDMFVRISKCCTPVPHDDIIGFVTRGRGVSIHRSDCSNAVSLAENQKERCIAVEWSSEYDEKFITTMEVRAFDRQNLLKDVSSVMSEHNVNIIRADTSTAKDGISTMRFDVELADNAQVRSLLQHLRRIEYVYSATRVMPQSDTEVDGATDEETDEAKGDKSPEGEMAREMAGAAQR